MDPLTVTEEPEYYRVYREINRYIKPIMTPINELPADEQVDIRQHIARRYRTHNEAIKHPDSDVKMVPYPPKETIRDLRPHDEAVKRLRSFGDGFFDRLIERLHELPFPTLIGGSSCLAAVDRSVSFQPDDIDLYIKNITLERLAMVNQVLQSVYPDNRILLVRRPFTLAHWVLDSDDKIIAQLQVNMLSVPSWTSIYEEYHADVVCIGYDCQKRQIMYHQERWGEYATSDKTVWFGNMFSLDNLTTLAFAAHKYQKRGIKSGGIALSEGEFYTLGFDMFDDQGGSISEYAVARLLQFKWFHNVVIGTRLDQVMEPDYSPPSVFKMRKINIDHKDFYYGPARMNREQLKNIRRLMDSGVSSEKLLQHVRKIGNILFVPHATGKVNLLGEAIYTASASGYPRCLVTRMRIHGGKLLF